MNLDGIVLDLDDTVFPTTRVLVPVADRLAVRAMQRAGLAVTPQRALAVIARLRGLGVGERLFEKLAAAVGAGPEVAAAGRRAWFGYDVPEIELPGDSARALDELAAMAPLALLTLGIPATQRRKIERLGIAGRFAHVVIVDRDGVATKTDALADLLRTTAWRPSRVVVVGDGPSTDIRAGNVNGCLTVRVRGEGENAAVPAEGPGDVAWREVESIDELPALLESEPSTR